MSLQHLPKLVQTFDAYLKNEDDLKNEEDLKNEDELSYYLFVQMIVTTNWHEHSMLTLLARVFNTYPN